MGNSPLKDRDERVYYLDPEREGESRIVRSSISKDGLLDGFGDENIHTLYDVFHNSCKNYPNKKCFGYREDDSPYKWISYKTAYSRSKNLGAGLIELGLKPHQDKVGIYSVNRVEWVLIEHASNCYSLTLVPLYDTLGPDACEFIISESELSVVVCSADKTSILLNDIKTDCLKYVVQMGELTLENKSLAESKGIKLLSFTGLEALGQNNPIEVVPPEPSDISTICYTSGTTGNPKGVILTHSNIVAQLAGVFAHGINIQSNDVHISYLPLAHVFERMIMVAILKAGACAGFYRGNILKLFEDIGLLKPTIFPSVPRLFNKLHDKVLSGAKVGGIKETLFTKAFNSKLDGLKDGYVNDSLWDTVVFKKVREALGGRVRLMITGSAPISKDVLSFLRIAFSCPVYEGYGQTETCAGATITLSTDLIPGHVGVPIPCIEIKLVDVPEMNYYSTDQPHPRGEICFRGPCCTTGYYKNEEKTQELIDEYGWLHSGDVGELLDDGSFKVIDRKKNIFKLNQGEYVAPEKLEIIYGKSEYVAQIFVYGDSLKSKLIAVVVPEPETVIEWAKENNLGDDLESLCSNEKVHKLILDDMARKGQEAEVRGFERIHALHLSPNPFTVESDLLTPTFKLKRPQAKNAFINEITALYERIGD